MFPVVKTSIPGIPNDEEPLADHPQTFEPQGEVIAPPLPVCLPSGDLYRSSEYTGNIVTIMLSGVFLTFKCALTCFHKSCTAND